MNCMKCGRETKGEQVFCPECLEVMAQCPVKPGTAVQLPHRPAVSTPKKAPRKKLAPEEQVLQLRRGMRWLALTILALVLALGITVSALIHNITTQEPAADDIGKNYNTIEPEIT